MSPGRRPSHGTRPATISSTPTSAMTMPSTMSIRPTSCMAASFIAAASFKERSLAGARGTARGRLALQVRVRLASHAAAPRLASDEADLEQVGLHDLRECFRLVVDRGRHRLEAHRPAVVDVHDGLEKAPVELV